MNNRGFSIIEIVVALGIISLLVVSFGKALHAVNDLTAVSKLRAEALAYTQESIELIQENQHDWFACTCAHDSCYSGYCMRGSDSQYCGLFEAYTSCWTAYPKNLTGHNDFYFYEVSPGEWQLAALNGEVETISANPNMTRQIWIENIERDSYGNIVTSGTPDNNAKKVTVMVWYQERGNTHEVKLKTILTAWENL